MTLIEIKPHGWGWKVFEALAVEPVFPEKGQSSALKTEIKIGKPGSRIGVR
jgi:hypothetical protein